MATRPQHYPYSFKALLDVPHRLLHPPPSQIKIGRVRSMSLTPLFEVKLSDVLDGQHLPPLSRKDFEEYLLFVEHSPENFYFLQWLHDYTRLHTAWAQSGAAHSPKLALSWSRAKETFFAPGAHYRLNLPSSILDNVLNNSGTTSSHQDSQHYDYTGPTHPSYPPPPALAQVRREVEDMLRESLTRFVTGSCGNSGRARGLFGIALGVITLVAGLAPVLMSILAGRGGRALRVAAIPIFWLGAWITIMSLHGVCIVIFLFGDARQLYPYELARPKITAPISNLNNSRTIAGTGGGQDDVASEKSRPPSDAHLYVDLERGNEGGSTSTFEHKPVPRSLSAASSVPGMIGEGESCELGAMTSTTPIRPAQTQTQSQSQNQAYPSSPTGWSFDFDALPVSPRTPATTAGWSAHAQAGSEKTGLRANDTGADIPTFGPLTRVLSPIVTRAQWEIVVRSAILAVLVAGILGAICLAVPARR